MFSSGVWAGVELDDESGRNDGSHAGIRYFSCKPKRGLFVALKRITKFSPPHRSLPLPPVTGGGAVGGAKRTATTPSDSRMKNESFTTARAFEAHSNVQMSSEFQVGDHVIVSGRDKGVLRYAGAVKFAPGIWLGVELDTPKGTCDGSKGGKQYFKCKPNHGIFVSPSKLTKIRSKDSVDYSNSNTGISLNSLSPSPNPPGERKKRVSTSQMKSSKGQYGSPLPTSLSLAVAPEITLEKGMSVFVNKEMGTVQYIGQTDFAPGVWLGVELKKPTGRNDGSVNGKRYFSCKTNYGIFVKPERASHRGINCAKLVKIDK
ncbi:PREDICTED: CAP-Gly domain-containing linker protein 4-like [Amphimedon queenslandica]|uniref:CAP-Gly domain-containing protein n=1 Tax=Amphimedon queenslandica TaxID=400682 RepID=A0A1X7TWJ4_AMPQE|nr:PREDICTED: CAP-Gly domain-containing linker protein 4-like [Amphimedon queenslandica]|eukprot:XP_019857363.1 PREDICTED: CAP-Gly domain-containing linker protein 4-like [Amphimedon queenslandica]